MKKILILKTGETIPGIAQEFNDFETWIMEAMSLSVEQAFTVSVYQEQSLPDLSSISAIVITGSPAMVTEDLNWIKQSEIFIRSAITAGIPVLGICFGHQLIAQALGGTVDLHPEGREIGTTEVSLTDNAEEDPVFHRLPQHFSVHTTHSQSVLKLPAGAVVLAGNAFEPHHGIRFAKGGWGVQFHPEFNDTIMRAYIEARSSEINNEGLNVKALLADVRPTPEAIQVLKKFAEYSCNTK